MKISGSLSAAGSVTLNQTSEPHRHNTAVVAVDGTYGTAVGSIQGTLDGTNWVNLACMRMDTQAVETTPTLTDDTERQWKVDITGMAQVRFNLSSIASGTVGVNISTFFTEGGNPLGNITSTGVSGAVSVTTLTIGDGSNVVLATTTGSKIGTSATQKLGFFNATPVVQPTHANQAAATSTTTTTATTTALETDLDDVRVLVNRLRTDLVNLGLIKGS